MAKKICGIVAGVSWAIFGISHLLQGPAGELTGVGVALYMAGILVGTFALIALAILGAIDYARRTR